MSMRWSYSRVDCFKKCPMQFKYRYLDKLKTIDDFKPDDALKLGTTAHDAIEKDVETAIKNCIDQYPITSDALESELLKIQLTVPKVLQLLPKNGKFEVPIADGERFIGYIDYLYLKEDGTYGIMDFKYTKDMRYYKDSNQLDVYKHYVEKLFGYKVSELCFMHVPKTSIRQKKDETARIFHNRIRETVGLLKAKIIFKDYDPSAIEEYWRIIGKIENTKDFTRNEQFLCKYCEYEDYCKSKDEWKMLPKQYQRQNNMKDAHKRIWLYGAPFSGKSTLANNFSKPYFFSTDGNAKLLDAEYELIMDKSFKEGRILKTEFGWNQFKQQIDELEVGDYDVNTIVVDLVDDMYKLCESYVCNQLKIDDVSDAGFGKGWNMLRSEFLPTMKKLLTLDYDVVLISHEDSSKNITKRNGDEFTSIKPNINDKVALKLAGMVDVVIRTQKIGDEYLLSFASDSVIFGGGRLGIKDDELPNNIDSINTIFGGKSVVETAKKSTTVDSKPKVEEVVEDEKPARTKRKKVEPVEELEETPVEETPVEPVEEVEEVEEDEKPARTKRRRRPATRVEESVENVEPEEDWESIEVEETEEKPVSRTRTAPRRTRRTRS